MNAVQLEPNNETQEENEGTPVRLESKTKTSSAQAKTFNLLQTGQQSTYKVHLGPHETNDTNEWHKEIWNRKVMMHY